MKCAFGRFLVNHRGASCLVKESLMLKSKLPYSAHGAFPVIKNACLTRYIPGRLLAIRQLPLPFLKQKHPAKHNGPFLVINNHPLSNLSAWKRKRKPQWAQRQKTPLKKPWSWKVTGEAARTDVAVLGTNELQNEAYLHFTLILTYFSYFLVIYNYISFDTQNVANYAESRKKHNLT